ncbi:MAG: protein O-mannosyl-transferase [Verrucomicrobiota bacterium]|jgi:tetratricopeptide (TPR) repeat protein
MTETQGMASRTFGQHLAAGWRQFVCYSERTWLRCLLLVFFGATVRLPALQGELLWDDLYLARENPFIKSPLLIAESFRHYLFPAAFGGHYRPVQTVSYIFDYWIWNTDAAGYHLSNLIWHVASGVLLFLLLQKLLEAIATRFPDAKPISGRLSLAAFLVALLWLIHPVHSAAVDYISGRADSLTFFFACAGWLLYLRARDLTRNLFRWSCYLGAGLSGLLALCSRETGFVWLLLFLLYLFIFDRKPALKAKLLVLTSCLALAAAYGTLRALPEYRAINATTATHMAATRAVLMLRAMGDYGRLMLWPANLHMERDVVDADSLRDTAHWRGSIENEYLSIAGLLVAAGLGFGACRKGVFRPVRIFGAGWFVITFLPISNLIQLNATVAEHWLYLPSVGFLVFLAGCCLEFPQHGRRIALGLACLAVVGLSARSFVRSSDWVSAETFYQRTLLAGGNSVRMGVNLAAIYSKRGENARAESILRKVLQIDPTYLVARNNLAASLSDRGQTKEATEIFDATSKLAETTRVGYPRNWAAALNLAHLAHARNDDPAALAIIDKARSDHPGTWEVVSFEAELLRKMKGPEVALPIVQEFARNQSWHCEAFIALGRLFCELGDVAHAEEALRHASWLDVHDAEALSVLAGLRMRQNRLEDAFETQRRAVARQPDQARQYLLLSEILEKMGRADEARAALVQVHLLQALAKSQPAARVGSLAN